ncbi:MAG: TetR/AcrR family transcriptional regulator [Kofleriaceae bacterium]
MRYQADHKDKVRAQILDEAARAIRRDGPHAVSLTSVMKSAGLTHGGFYSHFSSRDDMLAAAIARTFADTRERWAHETRDRTPKDGLTHYIDWYLSKAHRDERETGCVIAAIGTDVPELARACQDAFAAGYRGLVAGLAGHLALLRREDPDELAQSVIAELVGTVVLSRIERDVRRSDAILAGGRTGLKKRLRLS